MALSQETLSKLKPYSPSIEQVSLDLLIDSYHILNSRNQYELCWEEEQFSKHLVDIMKTREIRIKRKLTIDIEIKIDNPTKLPTGNNHPKRLPRIDIRIVSWDFEDDKELSYFFEAKNLCEQNWKKRDGRQVYAKHYLDRYISTGIENFRINRYYNGMLIGYILQGNIDNIILQLNQRLTKDSNTKQNIKKLHSSHKYENIYYSKHKQPSSNLLEIKHIFLKF